MKEFEFGDNQLITIDSSGQTVTHENAAKNFWPNIGQISGDRVAICGRYGIVDLFEGGNLYYQRYGVSSSMGKGLELVEKLAELRFIVNRGGHPFVFLCIPNKATCLPENYPLHLRVNPTTLFHELETYLQGITGNLFGSWMRKGEYESRIQYWFKTDSHWNSLGAWNAAREVVLPLGIELPTPVRMVTEDAWGGDLSGRWGGVFISEQRTRYFGNDQGRFLAFDNGNGLEHSAHGGRFLQWQNDSAPINASIAVVGDSFCGIGNVPEHMTYWLTTLFRKTSFLHGASYPRDYFDQVKADIYVFQTNERFLPIEPRSDIALLEFNLEYVKKIVQ